MSPIPPPPSGEVRRAVIEETPGCQPAVVVQALGLRSRAPIISVSLTASALEKGLINRQKRFGTSPAFLAWKSCTNGPCACKFLPNFTPDSFACKSPFKYGDTAASKEDAEALVRPSEAPACCARICPPESTNTTIINSPAFIT